MHRSKSATALTRSLALLAGLTLPLGAGCSAAGDSESDHDVAATDVSEPLTWEEYERQAARVVDGKPVWVVEWDLAFHSREELRAHYDSLKSVEKSTVHRVSVGGVLVDDVWNASQRYNLSYCVSQLFGNNYARMVAEMHRATQAWEAVADVNFIYVPSQDGNCVTGNTAVLFAVQPSVNAGGAWAFFPSWPANTREIIIDIAAIESFLLVDSPNMTTEGVLRHELGHILGLKHEHIWNASRPANCVASDDGTSDARLMNRYDQGSVMHYARCAGIRESFFEITALDADGASELYGRAPAVETIAYSASNTSSAQQNTEPMIVYLQKGDTLEAGTCGMTGASSNGDTYLRVRQGVSRGGAAEVASNDDACGGNGSNVKYRAATTGFYTVQAGCYSSNNCSGTVALKTRTALWTPWFDRDDPSGNGDGEHLNLLIDEGRSICASPLTAQCRRVSDKKDWKETGEVVTCSPSLGAICENANQPDGNCDDYEVRFACASEGAYTPWFDQDDPTGSGDGEHLGILKDSPYGACDQPVGVECRRVGGADWTRLGEKMTCTPSAGSNCLKSSQPDGQCYDYQTRFACPAVGAWTSWASLDVPSSGGEDSEPLGRHVAERGVCAVPLGIQCRRRSDGKDWTATGETMTCSPTTGARCRNGDQLDGGCDDYEVRFYCAEAAE